MHQQMIGAGAREGVEIALRLDDHQMHVDRLLGGAPHRLDHHRADRQVRHEAAVHHIDMDPVGPGPVDRPHLLAEPPEIGRQDDDDDGAGHASPRPCPSPRTAGEGLPERATTLPLPACGERPG